MDRLLIVAFDGMDKDLIEEFELQNIPQEEFGTLDNHTDITRIMTSELFASFITGKTHEEHGITGLKKGENRRRDSYKSKLKNLGISNVPGFYRIYSLLFEKNDKRKYLPGDLQSKTIFSKADAGKSLYVPVHSPSPLFMLGYPHSIMEFEGQYDIIKNTKFDTNRRLKGGIGGQPGLFDISKEFWNLVMIHLHDPDPIQDIGVDKPDLEKRYRELDEIAGKIKEEFTGWNIIFMSDHGRPKDTNAAHEHNENAFYSSNIDLFEEQTPKITDFHDKIIEELEKK